MNKLLCVICLIISLLSQVSAKELTFGVSISNSAQREAFYTLARQFEEANPEVTIRFKALTSEVYKQAFPNYLQIDKHFDVLYWHSGQRLFEYAEDGLILPITQLWKDNQLDLAFDHSVSKSLIYNGDVYGVPISYYQIGFYYSKPLFKQLNLHEPQSWDELLSMCQVLKKAGVPPIFIGTKSNWPATAWFDYLNLRLNGLAFHKDLTAGKVSFLDERIKRVFETWLQPMKMGCFIEEHQYLSWEEGLPYLYRDLVGMSMLGNYVIQNIPDSVIENIGFFPFPLVQPDQPSFEEAPIDVLLIPKNANDPDLAQRFLAFASQPNIQKELNATLGVLSPHSSAQGETSSLVKEAYEVLSNASGVSHYFDRDATRAFADQAMPVIDAFMVNQNIEKTLAKLEEIRLANFDSTN